LEMSREVVDEVEFHFGAGGAAEERTLKCTRTNYHVLLHVADPVDSKVAVGALTTLNELGNDIL
ncbi:hypothetical protein PENTCL1PPCAC_800, partial [Pristionchus entomophagus]